MRCKEFHILSFGTFNRDAVFTHSRIFCTLCAQLCTLTSPVFSQTFKKQQHVYFEVTELIWPNIWKDFNKVHHGNPENLCVRVCVCVFLCDHCIYPLALLMWQLQLEEALLTVQLSVLNWPQSDRPCCLDPCTPFSLYFVLHRSSTLLTLCPHSGQSPPLRYFFPVCSCLLRSTFRRHNMLVSILSLSGAVLFQRS